MTAHVDATYVVVSKAGNLRTRRILEVSDISVAGLSNVAGTTGDVSITVGTVRPTQASWT